MDEPAAGASSAPPRCTLSVLLSDRAALPCCLRFLPVRELARSVSLVSRAFRSASLERLVWRRSALAFDRAEPLHRMPPPQRARIEALELSQHLTGAMSTDALAGFDAVRDLRVHLIEDADIDSGLWGFLALDSHTSPTADAAAELAPEQALSGPVTAACGVCPVPLRSLMTWQFCLSSGDAAATRRSLQRFFTHPRIQQLEELEFRHESSNAVAYFLGHLQQLRVLIFGPGCGLPLSVGFEDRDRLYEALAHLPQLHTLRTPCTSSPTQLLPPSLTELSVTSPLPSNAGVARWLAALPLLKRFTAVLPATAFQGDRELSPHFVGVLGSLASLQQLEHVQLGFGADEQPLPTLLSTALTRMIRESNSALCITQLQLDASSHIGRLVLTRSVRPPFGALPAPPLLPPLFFHSDCLSSLTSLTTLRLRGMLLSDELLAALASLGPTVQHLELSFGGASGLFEWPLSSDATRSAAFWRALGRQQHLSFLLLALPDRLLDDSGIDALCGCSRLATLQLECSGPQLSEATAELLAKLPSLRALTFKGCPGLTMRAENTRRLLSSSSLRTVSCLRLVRRGSPLTETIELQRALAAVLIDHPHIASTIDSRPPALLVQH